MHINFMCEEWQFSQTLPKPRVPIVHFTAAKPPFILCVKWVSFVHNHNVYDRLEHIL